MFIPKSFLTLGLVSPLLLVACGGGGGSGSSSGSSTGTMNLNITDGPIEDAVKVVVQFTGISLKPVGGSAIDITFDEPKTIDLLQLQGTESDSLLENEILPAGDYAWMRLMVNAEQDTIMDSYIELNDSSVHELWVPSGSETGLKLVSGFTVLAGGTTDFTIDFDLRKSITDPGGSDGMTLRPTLRLIDNTSAGAISGMIAGELISSYCTNPSLDDGAVYVFSGSDVTPTDIQGTDTDPIATSLVKVEDSNYTYELGFLPADIYTVAYTCDAANDAPSVTDNLTFVGTANVEVTANTVAIHNFLAE